MRLPEARDRIAAVDWSGVAAALDERGYATVADLLDRAACRRLATLYDDRDAFPQPGRHAAP